MSRKKLDQECAEYLTKKWSGIPQKSKQILNLMETDIFDHWKQDTESQFWREKAYALDLELGAKSKGI